MNRHVVAFEIWIADKTTSKHPDMEPHRNRLSYSFVIAIGLFAFCLIYIPQWKRYAPDPQDSGYGQSYLTPWTVVIVTSLSLALALLSAPVSGKHPVLAVISNVLCALVWCSSVVFLLEYATGIRFPDLDIFFLSHSKGEPVSLYAARPSPTSAATSLFFSSALLAFGGDSLWRKRLYQFLLLAALTFPTLAGVRFLGALFFDRRELAMPHVGLSLPALSLYFLLGSGVLRLSFRPRSQKSPNTELRRSPIHPV